MAAPLLETVSDYLGSPEPAVRLILSILIGYPFALVYRRFLFHQSAFVIHLFHTLSGLSLAVFNFGDPVRISRALNEFRLLSGLSQRICSSWTQYSTYLLTGYYYTATDEYDIKWTMPHCVLTLKLIGLAFDYYDGGKETVINVIFWQKYDVNTSYNSSLYCSGIPALKRFCLGLFFLSIFATCGPYYPDSYYLTDEYEAQPFWYRCVFILLWAKVNLYKYVSCWHIFKRLKFLGNKMASQTATLFFLAIWHGLHSGYILCFSMEFIIVNVEKQAQTIVKDSPLLTSIANGPLYPLVYLVQQFIHWLFMGYPLVPFCLFTYDKWLKVYLSVYFCGHVFFFALILLLPYLRKALVPRKAKLDKKED
uniref:Lysophospholipid acyltransferase 5 n=1 Tax=Astyanax mexicanus TaxID=7994 RepID=A0A8B9GZM0_ASTMX